MKLHLIEEYCHFVNYINDENHPEFDKGAIIEFRKNYTEVWPDDIYIYIPESRQDILEHAKNFIKADFEGDIFVEADFYSYYIGSQVNATFYVETDELICSRYKHLNDLPIKGQFTIDENSRDEIEEIKNKLI